MRLTIAAVAVLLAVGAAPRAQRTAEVHLRIVDRDSGLPIRRVAVVSASTQPLTPIFSDEHGDVSVDVPADGRAIRVTKPGYVSELISLTAATDAVDIRLARGASIGGRIVDPSGAPVVARPVLVTAVGSSGELPRTVHTNDLGEYRAAVLPAGTYTVSLSVVEPTAPTARVDTPPDALPQTVVVVRGQEVSGIDFTVPSRVTCRPPATFALNGNPFLFASISGRVTTVEGAPLACVEVTAYRGANPVGAAVTDLNGRYSLERLRSGTFRLEFSRPGFVTLQWGQSENGQPGRPVTLRDRESVRAIDISLSRGGAISGQVYDEHGEPVENVLVRALRLRAVDDRQVAIGTTTAPTDERGRYRLFGLLPGRYLVSTPATPERADSRTARGLAAAYYPGTFELAAAMPVDVEERGDRMWTDFARVPTRVATITGTAVNSKNEPVTDRVLVIASQRSGAVIAEIQSGEVTGTEGAFTIPNVAPGDYVVQATSKRGEEQMPEFGRQYVTVGDSDPPPLHIQTKPGVDLHGRLIQDGVPLIDPRSVVLTAIPVDWDQTSLLVGTEQVGVDGAGALELPGVTGPRRFVLTSAPFNWFLKSVRLRGRDITDEITGFPTGGLAFVRDLEVVVSNHGATLEGDVLDGSVPATDFSVVLFSTNPAHWFHYSRFLKTVRANSAGKFRIEGLPDGEYFVVAIDPLVGSAADAWQDRDFLQSLVGVSRRLRLREGEGRSVSLPRTHR